MKGVSIYKSVLHVELVVDLNVSLLHDALFFGEKKVEFEPFYGALHSGTVAYNVT